MAAGTVILTPGASYALDVDALDLSEADYADQDWTARVALDITASGAAPPLLLVLAGRWCANAPSLGFAQRSARRAIAGYVLVDPVLPPVGGDWPDAPVTVVVTPNADADTRSAALGARLRGWEVIEGEATDVIEQIAARP